MKREELRDKISNLLKGEEKHIANILLDEVLVQMNAYHNQLVEQLARQVTEEKTVNLNQYRIITSLCSKENINQEFEFLFPMKNEDLQNEECDVTIEMLMADTPAALDSFYVEEDYILLEQWNNRTLSGCLHTESGMVKAKFRLVQDDSYLQVVADLKRLFTQNQIRWHSVNDGYLRKFYKLMIDSVESSLPEESKIVSYECEWDTLSEKMHRDVFPVWNVRQTTMSAKDFPVMQKDQIYYRYDFEVSPKSGWLFVVPSDFDGYFAWYEDKLCAFSTQNTLMDWNLFEIIQDLPDVCLIMEHEYLALSNGWKENMWNGISDCGTIRTEFELIRRLQGYEVSEYVEFLSYNVVKDLADENVVKAELSEDILYPQYNRPYMVLYFKDKNCPLHLVNDVIRFLVSEVQISFREYTVVGVWRNNENPLEGGEHVS